MEIPYYVHREVLIPGTVVESVQRPGVKLTVLRVEPALICSTPDGEEIVVLAHTCVLPD